MMSPRNVDRIDVIAVSQYRSFALKLNALEKLGADANFCPFWQID
jgi:hypothetical protein